LLCVSDVITGGTANAGPARTITALAAATITPEGTSHDTDSGRVLAERRIRHRALSRSRYIGRGGTRAGTTRAHPSRPSRVTRRAMRDPAWLHRCEWAVLGSNQRRPGWTLRRSEPESARLQALLEERQKAEFGPEQFCAASRVVTEWSSGVASAVNGRRGLHLGCICVPASRVFGGRAGC
jgi:hypothetical protein